MSNNNDTCFVMQPFDKGKFDKRFEDTFSLAIIAAGLVPYRVDRDPGVSIPIDDIELGIRNASLCFAEITTDNPNVWFELGYAIACGKDVIMVCSDERTTAFPFDIRHRNIINYDTDSLSSYNKLSKKIEERIKALLIKQNTLASINPSIVEYKGLSDHEITALVTIMSAMTDDTDGVSMYLLKQEMSKSGYTDIAVSISIKKLLGNGMIHETLAQDYDSSSYKVFTISELGSGWVLDNEDKLILKTTPPIATVEILPF